MVSTLVSVMMMMMMMMHQCGVSYSYCIIRDILQMAGYTTLESDLQIWKQHAQLFLTLANKTINDTDMRQTQLNDHVESAHNSVVR